MKLQKFSSLRFLLILLRIVREILCQRNNNNCFLRLMFCSDSITEIDGSENGVVVERHSRLELICRVTSGDRTPAFIIWQKENKVRLTDGQTDRRTIFTFFIPDAKGTLVIAESVSQ